MQSMLVSAHTSLAQAHARVSLRRRVHPDQDDRRAAADPGSQAVMRTKSAICCGICRHSLSSTGATRRRWRGTSRGTAAVSVLGIPCFQSRGGDLAAVIYVCRQSARCAGIASFKSVGR